jgi:hypothetical protein
VARDIQGNFKSLVSGAEDLFLNVADPDTMIALRNELKVSCGIIARVIVPSCHKIISFIINNFLNQIFIGKS